MNKFEDLKIRFFVYSGLIIISVLLIVFSDLIVMRGIVALAISLFAMVAIYEYINIVKSKKIEVPTPLLIGAVICEILSFFVYSQYPQLKMLPIFVILLFFIFLFIVNFKEIERSIVRISVASFGFIYISIPFGMFITILYMQSFEVQDGRYWVLYLLFVTKLTDIGAYFGGRLFGKRKLAPNISPKKTVFGAVSGIIFALIGSLIFLEVSTPNTFDLDIIEAIILGLVLGICGQFGDLCESLLKRDAHIQGSSKLPGLGGVLDLIDSLMFNIPILYVFLLG